MLHFYILDILHSREFKSIREIINEMAEYSSAFSDDYQADESTLRKN